MKTSIKTSLVHPTLDSAKSVTGDCVPLIEIRELSGEGGIDNHGRFIFRSVESIQDRELKIPFEDMSFITIDRQDAQNLYDMLTWAMEQIKPSDKEYKDIDIYGVRAISYERLYDYLHAEDHHIKKIKESGN